jgi:hypothetical protein
MNPLMWSCPIKVRDIPIEHTLELLLVEDQQVEKRILAAHSWGSVRTSHWLGERDTVF